MHDVNRDMIHAALIRTRQLCDNQTGGAVSSLDRKKQKPDRSAWLLSRETSLRSFVLVDVQDTDEGLLKSISS